MKLSKFTIDNHAYYDKLIIEQNNSCAICEKVKPYRLAVDHNHKCCIFRPCNNCRRGLLCYTCNSILGKARDNVDEITNFSPFRNNPILIKSVSDYLNKYSLRA